VPSVRAPASPAPVGEVRPPSIGLSDRVGQGQSGVPPSEESLRRRWAFFSSLLGDPVLLFLRLVQTPLQAATQGGHMSGQSGHVIAWHPVDFDLRRDLAPSENQIIGQLH